MNAIATIEYEDSDDAALSIFLGDLSGQPDGLCDSCRLTCERYEDIGYIDMIEGTLTDELDNDMSNFMEKYGPSGGCSGFQFIQQEYEE